MLDWYGTLVTDAQALRLLGYRTLAKAQRGQEAAEQSILKLFGSEAIQDADRHLLEAFGPDALDHTQRSAPADPLSFDHFTDSWFDLYLRSFAGTIAGGTSQIQRNIIAEHVLGLPLSSALVVQSDRWADSTRRATSTIRRALLDRSGCIRLRDVVGFVLGAGLHR